MNRISGANFAVASGASPLVAPAGAAVFQDLNLGTNTPGTYPNALWFTGAQESIMAVLAAAGIAPADTDNTQLLAAIRAVPAGRFLNVQVFTSSGTYTPTPGMSKVLVEGVGGGGGVGGLPATTNTQNAAMPGGGAGAYGSGLFTAAQIGVSQTVTIGLGGSAGAAGNTAGGNGGTTSVGALMTMPGGAGASGAGAVSIGSSQIYCTVGAVGGTSPSGTTIESAPGATGGFAFVTNLSAIFGGTGAASRFGSTPAPLSTSNPNGSNAAVPGGAPGAGASGGSSNLNCAAQPGAVGAGGKAIFLEYS